MNKNNLTCGHNSCYKRNSKICDAIKYVEYRKKYTKEHKMQRQYYARIYREQNKEAIKFRNENSLSRRYSRSKSMAKKRNIRWFLSKDQYLELIKHPCYYCNGPLPKKVGGLDRIDNDKGYSKDNVLPCCANCNRIRGTELTVEETKHIIASLKEFRSKNGT